MVLAQKCLDESKSDACKSIPHQPHFALAKDANLVNKIDQQLFFFRVSVYDVGHQDLAEPFEELSVGHSILVLGIRHQHYLFEVDHLGGIIFFPEGIKLLLFFE